MNLLLPWAILYGWMCKVGPKERSIRFVELLNYKIVVVMNTERVLVTGKGHEEWCLLGCYAVWLL
jgi:hypothetical protein